MHWKDTRNAKLKQQGSKAKPVAKLGGSDAWSSIHYESQQRSTIRNLE